MSKLRQALSVFGVALIAITLNACTEKLDLEELLRTEGGDWRIVNHCTNGDFPSSRVEFDRDGEGQVWLNRTCEVGYDCDNYLHFYWELDEDNERVTITWRNGFQAMMVCDDPQEHLYLS